MKKIRLKDVAERAGVAVNTASTILNRRPNSWASKETEERVFQAAKELGYRPSKTARALQSGRYHAIGFIGQDLTNPFYTTLSDEIESLAEKEGLGFLIENCRSNPSRERQLFETLDDLEVDGIILWLSDNEVYRDELAQRFARKLPTVVLGNGIPAAPLPVDAVLSDFSEGLGQAVRELHRLGHRRFAFLSAIAEGASDGARPRLFHEILAEIGVPSQESSLLRCGPSIDSAYEKVGEFLKECTQPRPTALVAMNDLAALGAMRAAIDAGLRIPDDLSIVGVDDIPFASFSPLSLSSIRQRYRTIADSAVQLLLARIQPGTDSGIGPRQIVFPTHFIPRESIGPAKG